MQLVVKYMCAAHKRSCFSFFLRILKEKLDDVDDERDVADEFPFNKSLPPAGTRRDLKKTCLSVSLYFLIEGLFVQYHG